MLRRLRGGPRGADPAAPLATATAAVGTTDGGTSYDGRAAAVAASPQTLDEKAAQLSDALVEIVPGITMPFTRQELVRIKKRFVSLELGDARLHCTIAACAATPELAASPLAKLVMRLMAVAAPPIDPRKGEPAASRVSPTRAGSVIPHRVEFDGFLTTLAILSVKQSLAVKRHVLFRVYDADRDGAVSVDDFVATLVATTSALTRAELKASIAAQFPSWTSTQSGETHLRAEAFQALFSDADVHAALTVAF